MPELSQGWARPKVARIAAQKDNAMIRKHSFAVLTGLFIAFAAAAHAEITYSGGDGRTIATAIVIEGAGGSSDGVPAEYAWLAQNRPIAQVASQALVQEGGRFYDVLTLQSGSATEEIYFDITGFFGNF
jgi:hypothetical protein